MKKVVCILFLLILSGSVFGAKYTINTSGTVKTQNKTTVKTQNPYTVYRSNNYVNSNIAKTSSIGIVDIVMDYSGSMSNCIIAAKKAMYDIVSQISPDVHLGFRVFGHNQNGSNPNTPATLAKVKQVIKQGGGKYKIQTKPNPVGNITGYCSATKVVSPIAKANATNLIMGMNSVTVGGATPLVYALDRAVQEDFRSYPNQQKKIILITDGGENCGGDACEYAKELSKEHPEVHIDVVLVEGNFSGLNCVANSTGGKVYNLYNLSDFSNVIQESINAPVEPASNSQQYEFYKE